MALLLVNFGGPRNSDEIAPFLTSLLQDRDVVRTRLPTFLNNWLFGRIARKRAHKIKEDYDQIGGRSPIYFDTESIAASLSQKLNTEVITFHRYLPATHADSLRAIESSTAPLLRVLPLFPQFCYATTGSIARFFAHNLSRRTRNKLRWISSYASHSAFITSYQQRLRIFLDQNNLKESETTLLFSAHGVPQSFSCEGDPYESECEASFQAVSAAFPAALARLSYQSKFGRGEWIKPYTDQTCQTALQWTQNRPHIVIVPITFTSDHIETLFEIEKLYLPLLRAQNLNAYRCPALNLEPYWLDALASIAQSPALTTNAMLIRNPSSLP
jgi:ferrochelatase